jgi:hypothetical protein
MAQGERHLRARKRDAAEDSSQWPELGRLGLQELAACRRVEVEVRHGDRRAGAARGRLDFAELAAFAADQAAVRGVARAAGNGKPGDRGDRGERLAAKAHRRDLFQVFQVGNLAGRVTGEGERQLIAGDAAAVVLDLHAAHAAFVERHRDARRTGVEAVFEQLLQHRGGPLDDFAGRDLGDEELRQHANGRHTASI